LRDCSAPHCGQAEKAVGFFENFFFSPAHQRFKRGLLANCNRRIVIVIVAVVVPVISTARHMHSRRSRRRACHALQDQRELQFLLSRSRLLLFV
jgi:hypothetical protein